MYHRVGEKRRLEDICLEDDACVESLSRCGDRDLTPKGAMEHEKRMRREIANSNERRRMQSINAGFASLKNLLPKPDGEKLSKAAILQNTADYVYQLEQEKTRLLSQNSQFKRLLNNHQQKEFDGGNQSGSDSPRDDSGSSPVSENMGTILPSGTSSPDPLVENLQRELAECRSMLETERCQRLKYGEYLKAFEGQIFLDKPQNEVQPKPQGRTILVAKSKDMKLECQTPKPVLVAPLQPQPKMISVAPAVVRHDITEMDIIKEEFMEVQSSDTIDCPVSHQALTVYSDILSTSRLDKPQEPTIVGSQAAGTIVTVVSSKPSNIKPTILEVRRSPDIDVSTSPVEDITMEDNQTVYIVNTSLNTSLNTNSACQKSLDTICEAIRHLEGEHMFPMEDQQARLDEEVVAEETYTVEDEFQHQSVPQDHQHHQSQVNIVKFVESSPVPAGTVVPPHPVYSNHVASSHPLGGSMSNLTLQMMPSEPQEVPLELTTTHRATEYHCTDGRPLAAHLTLSQSSTRPGVIVVKHT